VIASTVAIVVMVLAAVSAPATAATRSADSPRLTTASGSPYTPKTGANGNCSFVNRRFWQGTNYKQGRMNTYITSDADYGCWVITRRHHRPFDVLVVIHRKRPGHAVRTIERVYRGVHSVSGMLSRLGHISVEYYMNRPNHRATFGHLSWGKVTLS
jgi:hypothetical protein